MLFMLEILLYSPKYIIYNHTKLNKLHALAFKSNASANDYVSASSPGGNSFLGERDDVHDDQGIAGKTLVSLVSSR